jgi:hypothetical protein
MSPNDPWYEVVGADSPLDQGDLILRCPILTWDQTKPLTVSKAGDEELLKEHIASFRADGPPQATRHGKRARRCRRNRGEVPP